MAALCHCGVVLGCVMLWCGSGGVSCGCFVTEVWVVVVLLCSGVVMDVFTAVALYCYGALCGNIVWLLCFHGVLVDVLSHSVVVLLLGVVVNVLSHTAWLYGCCVSGVLWWMCCHTAWLYCCCVSVGWWWMCCHIVCGCTVWFLLLFSALTNKEWNLANMKIPVSFTHTHTHTHTHYFSS